MQVDYLDFGRDYFVTLTVCISGAKTRTSCVSADSRLFVLHGLPRIESINALQSVGPQIRWTVTVADNGAGARVYADTGKPLSQEQYFDTTSRGTETTGVFVENVTDFESEHLVKALAIHIGGLGPDTGESGTMNRLSGTVTSGVPSISVSAGANTHSDCNSSGCKNIAVSATG